MVLPGIWVQGRQSRTDVTTVNMSREVQRSLYWDHTSLQPDKVTVTNVNVIVTTICNQSCFGPSRYRLTSKKAG
jgi:hypothetical protein